jgi:shikimate dehydrogenase
MDSVLTLRDLASWSRPGVALAVLGQPIAHSISPPMHNAALAELARTRPEFSGWQYFRFEIAPADLGQALQLLLRAGFRGVNLTVPHKVLAFDLVAEVAAAARPVGAVNTLLATASGWAGHNTDGYGLETALRESFGTGLAGARVVILGAGGAARGAAVEALQRGCASLTIINRTRPNLDALIEVLRPVRPDLPRRGYVGAIPEGQCPPGALVINATSSGLRATDAPPIDLQALPRPASVYDMIYSPPRTRLLQQAEALAIPCANGLSMLVHQGAKALEIWSGIPADTTSPAMKAAVAARAA